jgi:dihydroorotase
MTTAFDLVLRGGTCVTPSGTVEADIGIRDGRIAGIGSLATANARETFHAAGLHILPGVIDSHVHFREPGLEHKETMETGSRAAVLGGVTAVFEMPNNVPPTTGEDQLADKVARAETAMHCDYAFYIGATAENTPDLARLSRLPGAAGVKLFMGSSTGNLLLAEDDQVLAVLQSGAPRISVHAEDEFRLKERFPLALPGDPSTHPVWRDKECARLATERLIALARKARTHVHVLHVTTLQELPLLAAARDLMSVETTVQHLTLVAPEAYEALGTKAQMNPPIRKPCHREALWKAVNDGLIDVLGSDHAPHTLNEKAGLYPATPSGMPGVQTLVPVMLDHVHHGRLSLERFSDLVSAGPARVFGLKGKGKISIGFDADFTIVDLKARRTIRDADMASRCGWTPYAGREVTGWPVATLVRGAFAMRDNEAARAGAGKPLSFI